ncbi:hypothetical protein JTB14_031666 [Gonioctena quinquepunctata]|nr:hypothetical protein JTB14_031666 [Gonioctena quinquepunctata]
MQKKPIMDLFNDEKVKIKDEYDLRKTDEIKTEYDIELNYDYVKAGIVGKEYSQETKSKEHIFIEDNKSTQDIKSRSSTTVSTDKKMDTTLSMPSDEDPSFIFQLSKEEDTSSGNSSESESDDESSNISVSAKKPIKAICKDIC